MTGSGAHEGHTARPVEPYEGPDLSWYCSWCGVRHHPGDICWADEEMAERNDQCEAVPPLLNGKAAGR